jgi:hypothetical protein
LGARGSKTHKGSYDIGRKLKLKGSLRKSLSEAYTWIKYVSIAKFLIKEQQRAFSNSERKCENNVTHLLKLRLLLSRTDVVKAEIMRFL